MFFLKKKISKNIKIKKFIKVDGFCMLRKAKLIEKGRKKNEILDLNFIAEKKIKIDKRENTYECI